MSVLSMRRCLSNLKSVALTILKLCTFNLQKFRGHVTLTTPPFWKNGGHVRIVIKNICTKLEDWNFNRFEAIVCFRLTNNALHPWPRFGQELTYFTKWPELPILSFYLEYLVILLSNTLTFWQGALSNITLIIFAVFHVWNNARLPLTVW